MPEPTGGLVEVTVQQSFGSENFYNVFHYWNGNNQEPTTWTTFDTNFQATVIPAMQAVQSTALSYVSIRYKTVLGLMPDLVVTPTITAGVLAGLNMPNYVAAGLRYNPLTKETRPGQKRIGGQTEEVVQGNTFTAAYITGLEALATALETSINEGAALYQPVVYSPFTSTRATKLVNPVQSITVATFLSSQVSRKRR